MLWARVIKFGVAGNRAIACTAFSPTSPLGERSADVALPGGSTSAG